MRTPEQIADAIDMSQSSYAGGEFRALLIAAAREAQQEAHADALNRVAAAASYVANNPREPQFAPEGETDDWRDDADNIGGTDRVQVGWQVVGADGTLYINTDFELTADQARHILAYLSEQSRKERA